MDIYVECLPDQELAKVIFKEISKKFQIYHEMGKSRVIKALLKSKKAIGLVDEDPWSHQPSAIHEFVVVENNQKLGTKIFISRDNRAKLVLLSPRLEDWLIRICEKSNIKMEKYNLPNDPEQLHGIINYRLNNFKRLLRDLEERSLIFREFMRMISNAIDSFSKSNAMKRP
ncbi:MAG: hypothetical protein ACP6IP_06100 [Candidatus Njordarchaeia archaeon]